jgi:hypothetical protein
MGQFIYGEENMLLLLALRLQHLHDDLLLLDQEGPDDLLSTKKIYANLSPN